MLRVFSLNVGGMVWDHPLRLNLFSGGGARSVTRPSVQNELILMPENPSVRPYKTIVLRLALSDYFVKHQQILPKASRLTSQIAS
jgi:hypothetical protein